MHFLDTLQVRASTYQKYESTIRCHIWPGLGEMPLNEIRPVDVQTFISNLECSNNQVHEVHKMLKRLFRLAVGFRDGGQESREGRLAPARQTNRADIPLCCRGRRDS